MSIDGTPPPGFVQDRQHKNTSWERSPKEIMTYFLEQNVNAAVDAYINNIKKSSDFHDATKYELISHIKQLDRNQIDALVDNFNNSIITRIADACSSTYSAHWERLTGMKLHKTGSGFHGYGEWKLKVLSLPIPYDQAKKPKFHEASNTSNH